MATAPDRHSLWEHSNNSWVTLISPGHTHNGPACDHWPSTSMQTVLCIWSFPVVVSGCSAPSAPKLDTFICRHPVTQQPATQPRALIQYLCIRPWRSEKNLAKCVGHYRFSLYACICWVSLLSTWCFNFWMNIVFLHCVCASIGLATYNLHCCCCVWM